MDTSWTSGNEMSHHSFATESLNEEMLKNMKHFRPSSPTSPHNESSLDSANFKSGDGLENLDDGSQLKCFESPSIENLFFDAGLDGFRIPATDSSPPCVTNSNFNIIGDTLPSTGKVDIDWWNYFDTVEPEDTAETNSQEPNDKRTCSAQMNGVGSPSTATDSPFWKIPKSASLPNNDW